MTERLPERRPIRPELRVICGPMFSGKSEELIKELRRAPHAKYKVMAFKPELDYRRGEESINSQDGSKFPATSIRDPKQILEMVTSDIDIVGIDEAQFFDENIVDVCLELLRRGKKVIVAGLDKNFRGEPFGPMAALKQEADHTDTLHAYCAVCGEPASFTQRVLNGEPAKYDDPIVAVGADELYQARCRSHHEVPGKPRRRFGEE